MATVQPAHDGKSVLPADVVDESHCKGSCDAVTRCGQRFILKHFHDLASEFPWLEMGKNEPRIKVGCRPCREASKGDHRKACHGGLWSQCNVSNYSAVQRRALLKHQNSDAHQLATRDGCAEDDSSAAPSTKEFSQLLKHAKRNPIGRDVVPSIAGHKKCRKMVWCLAEAHREIKRSMFCSGKGVDDDDVLISTTLYQDCRKGKLTVRFTAASSRLERRSGHLGTVDLAKDFSLDSIGIMQGTFFILKSFCVRGLGAPYVENEAKTPKPALDGDLEKMLLPSVETFVSDAASDEIRAGHMLCGQSTRTQYLPRLPGLKVVVRDKPHATRRNISRGWKADACLDKIINMFVLGEGSPTRLIQNSDKFKHIFASQIHKMDPKLSVVKAHGFVKNLGFAPHRFESLQKPLSRIVLFFPAFWATLAQISWERKGQAEGKAALAFLEELQTEHRIQAAMLADAGEENLRLTRLVDYEGFPLAELPSNVLAFRDRLRQLFSGPSPLCLRTDCFTQHMVQVLRHEYCFVLPSTGRGQNCKQLGGPSLSDDLIQKTLSHMSSWVALTEATLAAEFPCFEIQTAFSIFSIAGEQCNDRIRRNKEISRLQAAFRCPDNHEASEQLERMRFVAVRKAEEENLGSVQAWMEAVRTVVRTWSKPELRSLLKILVRFWAAGASSSGVEQSFAQAAKLTELLQVDSHVGDVMEARLW